MKRSSAEMNASIKPGAGHISSHHLKWEKIMSLNRLTVQSYHALPNMVVLKSASLTRGSKVEDSTGQRPSPLSPPKRMGVEGM